MLKFFSFICSPTKRKLSNIDATDFKDYNYENHICYARVVSIYDGDTCRIIFYHPLSKSKNKKNIIMKSVRLLGINTPEIKTKYLEEKRKGLLAKEALINLIDKASYKGLIKVKFFKDCKYGRPLVYLFDYNTKYKNTTFENSINYILLKQGHARKYNL